MFSKASKLFRGKAISKPGNDVENKSDEKEKKSEETSINDTSYTVEDIITEYQNKDTDNKFIDCQIEVDEVKEEVWLKITYHSYIFYSII